jgi:threonylcarbamoyladenosine tRNA methylthiotransferase MtaB
MRHRCAEAGYELVPFEAEADVYVVNTCTVTSEADREGRRLARAARRRAPRGSRVVLAGCSVQANREGMLIPEADLLLGNAEKMRLADHLASPAEKEGGLPEVRAEAMDDAGEASLLDAVFAPAFMERTRGFLKVQDGCDFACTFCATTLARGQSRSLGADLCAEQALRLVRAGHCEIVLTGVHLGAYGRDLRPRSTLSRLVERLLRMEGLVRLRLSSVEPGELTRELLRTAARGAYGAREGTHLCRHFHIPVQSGDDGVLAAMGRNYRAEPCARRFRLLADAVPGACLGADFIAGFPGEGAAAFERTLEWVREAPLAYLHVFPYSPREGTPASSLEGRVPGDEVRRRARALQELGRRKWAAFLAGQIGLRAEVLVERGRREGLLSGLTDNYLRVALEGPDAWRGRLVPVRLEPLPRGWEARGRAARAECLWGVPLT